MYAFLLPAVPVTEHFIEKGLLLYMDWPPIRPLGSSSGGSNGLCDWRINPFRNLLRIHARFFLYPRLILRPDGGD